MPKKCRYVTTFDLAEEPDDYRGAQAYLLEDDMLEYFDDYRDIQAKLERIEWHLCDMESMLPSEWDGIVRHTRFDGFIVVDAKEELTDKELAIISSYIRGQNSDGLGESFEQHFTHSWTETVTRYDDETGETYDEEETEEEMCSFDWRENHYPLHREGTWYDEEFWSRVDYIVGVWEDGTTEFGS